MIQKILKLTTRHKIISGIVILAGILGGYFSYTKIFNNNEAVRYATARVQKGALIVSISGSGQVSVSNQVDIKPKVSGSVVYVGVQNGQEVKAGSLIAQLDARDAQKAARDAEANLESAKLSFEKLKKPADALSILQAENSLTQAKDNLTKLKLSQEITYQKTLESKQKAEDDLKKSYEDGFNSAANAFLDLPAIMTGLNDIFFNEGDFQKSQLNIDWYLNQVSTDNQAKAARYRDDARLTYNTSRTAYTKNLDNYKAASRTSDTKTIDSLITETYETAKIIAGAVKTSNNYIDFVEDDMEQRDQTVPSLMRTHQTNLDSYTKTTNGHLSALLSIQTTIRTSKETITNSERDIKEIDQNHPIELSSAEAAIKEKEESFAKLKAGPDELDIQSSELAVKQKENALLDAKEKLADYFVRAPFDGVISKADVKKGDSVSSATVLATVITRQKLAEISLNEVDAAKIKVGQKATFTFDAIPELTITGQVAEIDAVGAVSQGVVTYNVKIAFDTQDERVKSAMSVSAAIVIAAKPNVLLVSNSAVKSQGGVNYVEIVDGDDRSITLAANATGAILKNNPRRQPVEIGTASDEFTEITNGLNEGDVIVTRTIQPTAQTAQTQQQSGGLRIPGLPGGGGGGGGFRGGGGVPR